MVSFLEDPSESSGWDNFNVRQTSKPTIVNNQRGMHRFGESQIDTFRAFNCLIATVGQNPRRDNDTGRKMRYLIVANLNTI